MASDFKRLIKRNLIHSVTQKIKRGKVGTALVYKRMLPNKSRRNNSNRKSSRTNTVIINSGRFTNGE